MGVHDTDPGADDKHQTGNDATKADFAISHVTLLHEQRCESAGAGLRQFY
jgi:hypothetical protein